MPMNNTKDMLRLAFSICRQSIGERFAGSTLGGLWVFIWPLVQLLIYMLIFGKLMGRRLGLDGNVYSYGIYLAGGLLAWTCFSNTLLKTTRCLIDKRNIIGKVAVDLRIFPLSINLEELAPFCAGLVLLALVDLFSGWQPDAWLFLLTVFAIYCQQVLATGIGLIFASFAVFSRDVLEIAGIGMQMAFWFTPVVYLRSILPEWLSGIIWINPMSVVTDVFQNFFVMGGNIAWHMLLYLFVFAHACLFLGLYLLHRWKKDILDEL